MLMYDYQAFATVLSMLILHPTASLVLKRRSPTVYALWLVYSSWDSDIKLQGVLVGGVGVGNVVSLLVVFVFLVLIGCFIDPSRYPIAPLWSVARWMSLCHEAQFVPSNLSFSANIGVGPVNDIIVFYTRGAERVQKGIAHWDKQ